MDLGDWVVAILTAAVDYEREMNIPPPADLDNQIQAALGEPARR
jgi:hypothetical protein